MLEACALLYCPGGQREHLVADPVLYSPGWHGLHWFYPALDLEKPGLHGRQRPLPSGLELLSPVGSNPASQTVQAVEAAFGATPATQGEHLLVPGELEKFPAGQSMQPIAPSIGWYCPARQALQTLFVFVLF